MDFDLTRIDGRPLAGNEFSGQAVLIVNVASRCGQRHKASTPTIDPLASETTG